MTEAKICPKCNGAMSRGRIMKFTEFTLNRKHLYVLAPDDESEPELSKAFSGKPLSKDRKPLAEFGCDECGFVEFYGLPA